MRNDPNRAGYTFIIADDDPEDQVIVQQAFKVIDPNLQCTAVYNGNQLLDLLLKRGVYKGSLENKPDAVILDLNMPVMDGLSALRTIKQIDDLREIPVYILYTTRNDNYASECLALGVAGIFVKPNDAKGISEIIQEIFRSCAGTSPMAEMQRRKQ
jgi:two-component system, response regulator